MKKENGFYFGLNEVKSKNIIMPCDKKHQKNIGVCMISKTENYEVALNTINGSIKAVEDRLARYNKISG